MERFSSHMQSWPRERRRAVANLMLLVLVCCLAASHLPQVSSFLRLARNQNGKHSSRCLSSDVARRCADGSQETTLVPNSGSQQVEEPAGTHAIARPRRNVLGAVGLGGFLLSTATPALAEEMTGLNKEEQQSVSVYEQNTPGVVFITNEKLRLQYNAYDQLEAEKVAAASGTGWVYDDEGHIVTNYHVIDKAVELTVRFIDGTELTASVVGADPNTDVAVLQVQLPPKRASLLKPLKRGVSASIKVGQEVLAIGNPFGLDHTLTKGIVSGVGRTIMSVGGRPIQGAIQTDASINPGNSGGPLLDSRGQVIGMNTVIFSPSGASAGVGFAIPSDTVTARVQSILKFGYVKRPSLGLYLAQDGLTTNLLGVDGALVTGFQKRAAALKAGVQIGDIVVSLGGRTVKRLNDIYAELDVHEPGETIQIKLKRPEDLDALREGVRTNLIDITLDCKLKESVE